MARLFDRASSEYLIINSTPIIAAPLTISLWVKSDDLTIAQRVFFLGDKDTNNDFWELRLRGEIGGDPVTWVANAGGSFSFADTSTGYLANTDHHIAAVETASNDRAVFIDGGSKGTDATNISPPNADTIAIAAHGGTDPLSSLSGQVAEAGLWNVALSDTEVALLAKGFSPLFIQPHNLVAYWPLIRDDDNDLIGGFDLTAFNTPSVATHPPLAVYPGFGG